MTPDKYSEYLASCPRNEYEAHMGRGDRIQPIAKKKKVQKKAKKKAKRV